MNSGNYIKYSVFFLLALFFEVLIPRVFLPPLVERWYWYENTIEYPIDFYYHNRRSNFCWDVGASFNVLTADKALFTNQILRGENLAALFHGASQFQLNDFQPLTSNIVSNKGQFSFFPDYVFNESRCEFNIQVSRDFEYEDESYVRGTFRCILPFKTQKVTNIAAGNMYYNTQSIIRRNKAIDAIEKNASYDSSLIQRDRKKQVVETEEINKRSFPASQVLLRQENGQDVFAIQASYVFDSLNDPAKEILIDQKKNQVTFPYLVINKNGIPADGVSGSYLSLDDICRSVSVLNQSGAIQPYYGSVDGVVDSATVSSAGVNFIVVNNAVFPDNQNSALLTLYTYPDQQTNNDFLTYGNFNLPYSVLTNPDYVSDFSYGDLASMSTVFFGNGLTGEMVDSQSHPYVVNPNLIFRILATGNYGITNSDQLFPWNRSEVEFRVPPVIVQRSSKGFPSVFGITETLPNHPYTQSGLPGQQFQKYADYLSTVSNNTITLLNEDGTFLNNNSPYAVFWYGNDYSQLLTTFSPVLNTLYITSSIDPVTNLPTDASQLIARTIKNSQPEPPTPCCDELKKEIDALALTCGELQGEIVDLADWTVKEVYQPLAGAINNNSEYLNNEIESLWTLLNINNNIIGNVSPITVSNGSQQVGPSPSQLFSGAVRNVFNTRIFDSFQNAKWKTGMQYNGFHDSGLGDLSLELLIGTYFLQNRAILDVYIGLDCPTGASIDGSNSYLAVGLGNNGHFVGKIGLQGFLDIDYLFRLRLSGRCYLEHGLKAKEQLVPGLQGFPVFGIIPVKMDANVSWNGGLVQVNGSLYANDFSGLTVGYQFWKKGEDAIIMTCLESILIPNFNSQGDFTDYISAEPDFSGVIEMSRKFSHTVSFNFFSRLVNECFFNAGMSRVFRGEQVPQVTNFQAAFGISY
jgi:hypothetical protein